MSNKNKTIEVEVIEEGTIVTDQVAQATEEVKEENILTKVKNFGKRNKKALILTAVGVAGAVVVATLGKDFKDKEKIVRTDGQQPILEGEFEEVGNNEFTDEEVIEQLEALDE